MPMVGERESEISMGTGCAGLTKDNCAVCCSIAVGKQVVRTDLGKVHSCGHCELGSMKRSLRDIVYLKMFRKTFNPDSPLYSIVNKSVIYVI